VQAHSFRIPHVGLKVESASYTSMNITGTVCVRLGLIMWTPGNQAIQSGRPRHLFKLDSQYQRGLFSQERPALLQAAEGSG
jgi:hypothetical protein